MTLPTPDTTLMPLGPGGPDWLVLAAGVLVGLVSEAISSRALDWLLRRRG